MSILKSDFYKFSELDEQIQEQVVERTAELLREYRIWFTVVIDPVIKMLSEAGIVAEISDFTIDLNFENDFRFSGKVISMESLIRFFGLKEEYLKIADIDEPISIFIYKMKNGDEHAIEYRTTSSDNEDQLDKLFKDLEKGMTILCKEIWITFFYAYKCCPKFAKKVIIPELDARYYSDGEQVDPKLKQTYLDERR